MARGEKLLGEGEADQRILELDAILHPRLEGIEPQKLRVRAYAVDALPGRERAYSAAIDVWVMSEEEHMIWVTGALSEWFDAAVEVRDQESLLLRTNEELLARTDEELSTSEARRQLREQAAAERANGHRLEQLVGAGDALLQEAARNEEFNSNTLDEWAEMVAALDDIARQRMPAVAERLENAARRDPGSASASPEERDSAARRPTTASPSASKPAERTDDVPHFSDTESSFDGESGERSAAQPAEGASPPPTTLVSTQLPGKASAPSADGTPNTESPARQDLDAAVAEQRALMEEFQRVAGEIEEVLANLEGNTFVKRLKALSRLETDVARRLDASLASAFGAEELPQRVVPVAKRASEHQEVAAERASLVRRDIAAYVDRLAGQGRDAAKFQTVHREMGEVGVTREMNVIRDLTSVSRHGEAIAAAENLADELDRWAEILVGPG